MAIAIVTETKKIMTAATSMETEYAVALPTPIANARYAAINSMCPAFKIRLSMDCSRFLVFEPVSSTFAIVHTAVIAVENAVNKATSDIDLRVADVAEDGSEEDKVASLGKATTSPSWFKEVSPVIVVAPVLYIMDPNILPYRAKGSKCIVCLKLCLVNVNYITYINN